MIYTISLSLLPVEEHNLHINVLSVLVEKVLEEVGDGLVCDVAAHHDVPAGRRCHVSSSSKHGHFNVLFFSHACTYYVLINYTKTSCFLVMILFYKVEFFEVRLEGGHAIKSNLFMNLKSVSGLSSSLFLIFHFLFTFVRAHF